MTSKNKTNLLTAFFFFGLLIGLKAQDKYEYSTIAFTPGQSRLAISLNGKEFTEEKVELPKTENSALNSNPILNKINEFQNKGWEVMSINIVPVGQFTCHFAYLRKKKQ